MRIRRGRAAVMDAFRVINEPLFGIRRDGKAQRETCPKSEDLPVRAQRPCPRNVRGSADFDRPRELGRPGLGRSRTTQVKTSSTSDDFVSSRTNRSDLISRTLKPSAPDAQVRSCELANCTRTRVSFFSHTLCRANRHTRSQERSDMRLTFLFPLRPSPLAWRSCFVFKTHGGRFHLIGLRLRRRHVLDRRRLALHGSRARRLGKPSPIVGASTGSHGMLSPFNSHFEPDHLVAIRARRKYHASISAAIGVTGSPQIGIFTNAAFVESGLSERQRPAR